MGECKRGGSKRSSDSTVSFEDASCGTIRSVMNEYRVNDIFTDLTLKFADGQQMKVHKIVLCAACSYFHEMFSDIQENNPNEVGMCDEFDMQFLEIVIGYLYTGKIEFSSSVCSDIFITAKLLELLELEDFCTEILKDKITMENCLERFRFAVKYQSDALIVAATDVIKENYKDFLTTYCTELNFDEFKSIINGIDLRTVPEFTFEIIHRWFTIDLDSRQEEFNELWSGLDFSRMSKEFIKSEILEDELLKENLKLMRVITQTAVEKLPNLVLPEKCLNILSDEGIHEVGLAPGNSFITKVKFEKKLSAFTGAPFKNFIYVSEPQTFSVVNLWTGRVETLPQMDSEGKWRVCIEFNGKIYCCGGLANRQTFSTVEIFDISTTCWTTGPSMNENKYQFGLCAGDDRIYAFGGPDGTQLEYLDPREGAWKILCEDATKSFKCLLLNENSIYCVCQGEGSKIFDIKTNTWGEKLARVGNDSYFMKAFDLVNLHGKFYGTWQNDENWQCNFSELDEATMTWTSLDVSHLLAEKSCVKFFASE